MSRAQLTSTVEQNTGGAVPPFVAGKNKIINGDFSVWQRGTSFTQTAGGYFADRFTTVFNGTQSIAISQQSFTPGNPITGYEPIYFARLAVASASSGMSYNQLIQKVENIQTLAGQTATFSFWAKATSGSFTINPRVQQFTNGGLVTDTNIGSGPITLTTSWVRYTTTFTVPSISGRTISGATSLNIGFDIPQNTTWSLDTWGWQLEAGSVATPFTTASNTLQGELALCQRYFTLTTYGGEYSGSAYSTTAVALSGRFPVSMRITPTPTYSTTYTNAINVIGAGTKTPTGYSTTALSTDGVNFLATGMSGLTVGNPAIYVPATAQHQFSAEL